MAVRVTDAASSAAKTQPAPQSFPSHPQSNNEWYELFVSGAVAGSVARSVTAPLDRVRILYQVNPERHFTVSKAWKSSSKIIKSTGIQGLWRGNMAAVLRIAPYSAVTYTCFDRYESYIVKHFATEKNVQTRFIAGAAAGATATLITYPLDLLRARMAAHWGYSPRYTTYSGALKEIVRVEGSATLYAGIRATLIGIIPYAGISFSTFETLKHYLVDQPEKDAVAAGEGSTSKFKGTVTRLFCGGVAGVSALTVTYPLHVVRRRMQVIHRGEPGSASAAVKSSNPLHAAHEGKVYDGSLTRALRHVYKTEGFAGMYKGVTLAWVKAPIAVALSFTINDFLKQQAEDYRKGNEADDEIDFFKQGPLEAQSDVMVPKKGNRPRRKISPMEQLGAGAIAGAVAKSVIAPADRVKILYQVNPKRAFSLTSAWKTGGTIVHNSGVGGLWRGNGAMLIRVMPYSAITYTTFDQYQALIQKHVTSEIDIASRFCAGASAGATATTMTYPLDLMRARMAAHWATAPKYEGYPQAFKHIVETEGARSLLNGLVPTLVGIVPYAGLSFATFETLKERYREKQHLEHDLDIPVAYRLAFGGVAGLFAQSVTYPLDLVRRRMQVAAPGESVHYRGIISALVTITKEEGYIGLYKGLSMNWIKGPIAVSTSFLVNDFIKGQLSAPSADEEDFV